MSYVDGVWLRQRMQAKTDRINAEVRDRAAGVTITTAEQAAWDAELEAERRAFAADHAADARTDAAIAAFRERTQTLSERAARKGTT